MHVRTLARMLSRPPDPPTPLSSRGKYLGWHAAMAMAISMTLIQLRMLRPSRPRWDPWTRPIPRPDGSGQRPLFHQQDAPQRQDDEGVSGEQQVTRPGRWLSQGVGGRR